LQSSCSFWGYVRLAAAYPLISRIFHISPINSLSVQIFHSNTRSFFSLLGIS
jgi:hypothetical protein